MDHRMSDGGVMQLPESATRPTERRTLDFAPAGEVRPLRLADIPAVVELHRLAFPGNRPREQLVEFLHGAFFGHPWRDSGQHSLGCVDRADRLIGCLGIMPRPMQVGERLLRVAVTHNFIVHPAHRSSLAAVKLLHAATRQGQDLTLADGDEASRRISESMGGKVFQAWSSRWLRVLRPATLGAHLLWKRVAGSRANGATPSEPNGDRLDGSAVGRSDGPGQQADAPQSTPCPDRLLDLLTRVTAEFSLRPSYSERSLESLLGMLARTRRPQKLRGALVRGTSGEAAGWYLYYSRPGRIGQVLQLGALRGARKRVLRALFIDARLDGNLGLSGQVDPFWRAALRRTMCLIGPGKSWTIGYSHVPAVLNAISSGDAFLSRLEGEGWIRLAF
jgi:hypothetical protein